MAKMIFIDPADPPQTPRDELRAILIDTIDQAALIDTDQTDAIAEAITALFEQPRCNIRDRWETTGDGVIDVRYLTLNLLRETVTRHSANRTVR